MRLREVLHAHVPILSPTSTFRDAVDKMDVYQFPALVICNADMAVLGVVTEGDLCRESQRHGGLLKLANRSVMDFATSEPICSSPEAEISDALMLMLQRGLTILPVVEDSRLLGVVLRVDLMHSMLLDQKEQTFESQSP